MLPVYQFHACAEVITVLNCNHLRPTQPSIPPGSVNEYQLRLGRQKAGMVHSVSGWTRGVQVKLWDPLRTRAIPERLFTTTRYTNPRLPYLTLTCGNFCFKKFTVCLRICRINFIHVKLIGMHEDAFACSYGTMMERPYCLSSRRVSILCCYSYV